MKTSGVHKLAVVGGIGLLATLMSFFSRAHAFPVVPGDCGAKCTEVYQDFVCKSGKTRSYTKLTCYGCGNLDGVKSNCRIRPVGGSCAGDKDNDMMKLKITNDSDEDCPCDTATANYDVVEPTKSDPGEITGDDILRRRCYD